MSIWAVIVAAGSGTRFGGSKQFAALGDRRVLDWSVEVAKGSADGVVVVLNENDYEEAASTLQVDFVVVGGATRSASTKAGLESVPEDADIVLVHDAARPLVTSKLFDAVIGAVTEGADAAVPGIAIPDTVKTVSSQPTAGTAVLISGTLNRDELVAVQTPQAFRAAALRSAYAAEPEATDDAAVIERMGGQAVVVPGDPRNIKLTVPQDMVVVEALMNQ